MNSNENCNVTGVSKNEFSGLFNRVLKDYCLVPFNQIIE